MKCVESNQHSPYHPYLPFVIPPPPRFPLFCQLFYPVLLKHTIIYTENNGTYLLPKTRCRKGYSHQKQTVISHLHLNQTGNTESLFLLNMTWRLQIPWAKRIYSSIIFLPQTLSCKKKKKPFIYKVNNKAKRIPKVSVALFSVQENWGALDLLPKTASSPHV